MFCLKAQLTIDGAAGEVTFEIKGKQDDFWIARNALHVALARVAEDAGSATTDSNEESQSIVSDIVFTPEAGSESHHNEQQQVPQPPRKRQQTVPTPAPTAPWAPTANWRRNEQPAQMTHPWLIWNNAV